MWGHCFSLVKVLVEDKREVAPLVPPVHVIARVVGIQTASVFALRLVGGPVGLEQGFALAAQLQRAGLCGEELGQHDAEQHVWLLGAEDVLLETGLGRALVDADGEVLVVLGQAEAALADRVPAAERDGLVEQLAAGCANEAG